MPRLPSGQPSRDDRSSVGSPIPEHSGPVLPVQSRNGPADPGLGDGILAGSSSDGRRQGRYWILTIPFSDWKPPRPSDLDQLIAFIQGQQELGTGGYHHWQLFVITTRKVSLRQLKPCFANTAHCELTRSDRAEEYCLKDDSCVQGTRFSVGTRPVRRNVKPDWERIWELCQLGDILAIPASIRVQNYRTLCQIRSDYATPIAIERMVFVYWGRTGSGKSRRAWLEGGLDAYCKDPRSKFWCGYRSQENVVIDEFRGGVDVAHLLRWLDRYPVNVELKGSSTPLMARKVWITSNLPPSAWYPLLEQATLDALMRRFTEVIEFE